MADSRSFGSFPCRSLRSLPPLSILGPPCADLHPMRSVAKLARALRNAHGHLAATYVESSASLLRARIRASCGLPCACTSRSLSTSRALAHSWWRGPAPGPPRDTTAGGRTRKQPLADAPAVTEAATEKVLSPAVPLAPAADVDVAAPAAAAAAPKAVRKRRTPKIAATAEPEAPGGPPPLDLDAGVPPAETAAAWESVKQWVVFSDLHVSTKTIDVAVQVLRAVHSEAVRRDAGILFLGAPSPEEFTHPVFGGPERLA